jgi:hypothetical protein
MMSDFFAICQDIAEFNRGHSEDRTMGSAVRGGIKIPILDETLLRSSGLSELGHAGISETIRDICLRSD